MIGRGRAARTSWPAPAAPTWTVQIAQKKPPRPAALPPNCPVQGRGLLRPQYVRLRPSAPRKYRLFIVGLANGSNRP
jgi:hypothetical protein